MKVEIPNPCYEDWNSMKPLENGRFCLNCTKKVIDFTTQNKEEIDSFLRKNKNEKICGRFLNSQINKFDLQISQDYLVQRKTFKNAFFLALFVVMGTTLFSCKDQDGNKLGEVIIVKDSIISENQTMGVMLPEKTKQNCTIGDVKYDPKDSLSFLPPPPPKSEQVKFVKQPN